MLKNTKNTSKQPIQSPKRVPKEIPGTIIWKAGNFFCTRENDLKNENNQAYEIYENEKNIWRVKQGSDIWHPKISIDGFLAYISLNSGEFSLNIISNEGKKLTPYSLGTMLPIKINIYDRGIIFIKNKIHSLTGYNIDGDSLVAFWTKGLLSGQNYEFNYPKITIIKPDGTKIEEDLTHRIN